MKRVIVFLVAFVSAVVSAYVFAQAAGTSTGGAGEIAGKVTSNLDAIAKLITAGAYVAGLALVVGAIVKFKAHKDNPTQITIGTPIALLFVGAALIFSPTVFLRSGETMFGSSGTVAMTSGISKFTGATKSGS